MIGDLLAVAWKEWRELLFHPSSRQGALLNALVLLLAMGVVLPWQVGGPWLTSVVYIGAWGWIPTYIVSTVITDSFAGERERHTLETLLTVRLSDEAIVLGKIGAAVAYGTGVSWAVLLSGVLTVNLTHAGDGVQLYPGLLGIGVMLLSGLLSLTTASVGALVSLHAATVRQAQQTLNLVLMLLFLVPLLLNQLVPLLVGRFLNLLVTSIDPSVLIAGVLIGLTLADVLLVAVTIQRFRRTQLLLD